MCRRTTAVLKTPDGWRLLLRRVTSGVPRRGVPLLLLHGFGANGFVFDGRQDPSLGRYLARQGFDVWLLEFRGTRSSYHAAGPLAFARISVDAKIRWDVPAAIAHVRGATGAAALDLVGFSLGGAIAYAHVGRAKPGEVRRLVTLAAPLRFELPRVADRLGRLARLGLARRWLGGRLPLAELTALGARTHLVFPARDHFNLANVDRGVLLEMMRHGTEDVALLELAQLVGWAASGRMLSLDGAVDHGARLGEVTLPVLLLAGGADRHVRPASLRELFARLGSRQKQLVVVGPATGARSEYGHTDLLLGPRAPSEVFPHVAAWLAAEADLSP